MSRAAADIGRSDDARVPDSPPLSPARRVRMAIAGRTERSTAVGGILMAVVVAVLVGGVVLWSTGSDGTKQAELGAGLVSTGVFGLLLLLIERALSRQTADVGRKVSLAATPEPAVDSSEAAAGARGGHAPATPPSQPGRQFKAVVDK